MQLPVPGSPRSIYTDEINGKVTAHAIPGPGRSRHYGFPYRVDRSRSVRNTVRACTGTRVVADAGYLAGQYLHAPSGMDVFHSLQPVQEKGDLDDRRMKSFLPAGKTCFRYHRYRGT